MNRMPRLVERWSARIRQTTSETKIASNIAKRARYFVGMTEETFNAERELSGVTAGEIKSKATETEDDMRAYNPCPLSSHFCYGTFIEDTHR